MITFFTFLFGAAIGSFLNVVILRYSPEKFLLGKSLLGRSHCPHCRKVLRWFELAPIVSFLIQRGRCRACGARLNAQYPIVETLSGMIFVFVPLRLYPLFFIHNSLFYILSLLWILVFLILLLIFFIDLRLSIIPDETNLFLGLLGILIVFSSRAYFGLAQGSFLGSYSLIFGLRSGTSIWLNHFFAAFIAGALFVFIILVTRGRGMGMGDLKFAIPLGFAFGWPDIILVLGLSFIIGSFFGAYVIVRRGKSFKSRVPFGPFLALAAALVFFFGETFVGAYFKLFGIF